MKYKAGELIEFIEHIPRNRAGRIRDNVNLSFEKRIGPRITLNKSSVGMIIDAVEAINFWKIKEEQLNDKTKRLYKTSPSYLMYPNVYIVYWFDNAEEHFVYEDEI